MVEAVHPLLRALVRRAAHAPVTLREFAGGASADREGLAVARIVSRHADAVLEVAGAGSHSGAVKALVGGSLQWLWARNQFLRPPERFTARLAKVYARGFQDAATAICSPDLEPIGALGCVFQAHATRLRRLYREAFGPRLVDVPAAEYSPSFQIAILGLDPTDLRGPVLDLGCGRRASLVSALRRRGLQASGIDRWRGDDWLTHDYEPHRFALVCSHLSFSLHFLEAHLSDGQAAAAHAHAYRRILQALAPGGLFAYAPSLPFIEELLPSEFQVTRRLWRGPAGLFRTSHVRRCGVHRKLSRRDGSPAPLPWPAAELLVGQQREAAHNEIGRPSATGAAASRYPAVGVQGSVQCAGAQVRFPPIPDVHQGR